MLSILTPDVGVIFFTVFEINFRVLSSAGPVGLKFTGPSAKLLITYIIFQFFFDVCHLCLQVNNKTVFLSVKPQSFVFILPYLLELVCSFGRSRCLICCVYHLMIAFLFFFETFAFGNSSFVSRLLALFGMIQKKKNTCKTQRLITLLVQRNNG